MVTDSGIGANRIKMTAELISLNYINSKQNNKTVAVSQLLCERNLARGKYNGDKYCLILSTEVVCNVACTMQNVPVCGTNGLTYGNLCQLESEACL